MGHPAPRHGRLFLLLFVFASSSTVVAAIGSENVVRYGRDVRPILSDRCFQCHGMDPGHRFADLRLDTSEGATAVRDGGAALVPGDPEASELWRRITSEDPAWQMPPPGSNRKPLAAEERDLIRRWIEDGAEYESHWAFTPPRRPAPPEVAPHPIDAFILAELHARGLQPSPPVELELALRRLFLDLTGLPPTPEELDAFLADIDAGDPDEVWSRWIDRLFAEEPYRSRYAERLASPWLDQARYADTNGIHMDAGRQMWLWRDWVLAAYRDNLPFDRFLIEQLAGDQLPEATVQQIVASGFNRNHVITDEGGAIDAEYLVEYAADRVETTSSVFLGVTMRCARCHDHKFDPFTQEDYFRLFDFFHSNDEPGLYSQRPDPKRAFEPFLEVPTEQQLARREELEAEREQIEAQLAEPTVEEQAALEEFLIGATGHFGLRHEHATVIEASSREGATLTVLEDGSVLAGGSNPDRDVHDLRLRVDGTDLRLLQLDVLGHESLPDGKPGRAENGNAVLTGFEVEVVSVADPNQRRRLELDWLWASREQRNGPFNLEGTLDDDPASVWAIQSHELDGDVVALFGTAEPFGYEGGTELHVRLGYESIYARHTFGRVRLGVASLAPEAREELPVRLGRWYHAGPFAVDADAAYATHFGPELDTELDREALFLDGELERRWTFVEGFADETLNALASGSNIHYLAREIWSPTARELEVAVGSDDGFALYIGGVRVAAREVGRGVAPDQDRAVLPLREGRNVLAFEVVNTGGSAGFWFKALEGPERLAADVVAALVDTTAWADGGAALERRVQHAWRLSRSPEYAAGLARLTELETETAELLAATPRTMVMRDRAEPRTTYLLRRGEYDKPDETRPTPAGIPGLFGELEGDATRLDLARWMTSPENPLVARVAVNRFWQLLFGRGLVATSGNFGYQGAFPTHPELLDWLAVEFVENGWNVQALLKQIVTSETYRQSPAVTAELLAADPENLWLARFPRRRLDAERLRDQALHVSGLLVEQLGGESVKPYQPEGLWREVAMNQSNTRTFERGTGDDLWRRSLYTYWKRACPPPALLTFDAPTRESCVVQRPTTNTPLQALVLWNDEQFLEAARVLAERTLVESEDDGKRLRRIFRRCTGRRPTEREVGALREALAAQRARYAEDAEDAEALASIGEAPRREGLKAAEVAAWTMVSSALLNLHATITIG